MDTSDRAGVPGRLEATSRWWLRLVAGQLAEQGADAQAGGLLEAARADIVVVCARLANAQSAMDPGTCEGS